MSLWRTLLLLFLPLAILVPILVFAGVARQQAQLQTLIDQRDAQAATEAAATLTQEFDERLQLVRGISEQAAVSDDFNLLLDGIGFLERQFEGGIAVFSLEGELLAVRGNSRDSVADWASPASPASPYSQAMRDSTGEPLILVTAVNERVQVVGAIDPRSLSREVLELVSGEDMAAVVVSAENQIIYTQTQSERSDLLASQIAGIAQALGGQSGTAIDEEAGRLIAYSPIEPVGWAIVTDQPWMGSAENTPNLLFLASLVLVPLMLILLGVIWFGERQVVQPLQRLSSQAAALGQGQFEEIEAAVGGIESVRQLQTEMVAMSRKVRQAQDNLRSQVGAITQGQEEERRRLARELHDDTIQNLIALNQQIQLAQMEGGESEELAKMQQMVAGMIADVRRFTHALRPIGLEELGLFASLELLVSNAEQQAEIPIHLQAVGNVRRMPMTHEFALYRIVQESLNNLVQHANATRAAVRLTFEPEHAILKIEDDGGGFEVPANVSEMAHAGNYGLLGIHERAELIGATVDIASSSDEGTQLTVRLPIHPNAQTG